MGAAADLGRDIGNYLYEGFVEAGAFLKGLITDFSWLSDATIDMAVMLDRLIPDNAVEQAGDTIGQFFYDLGDSIGKFFDDLFSPKEGPDLTESIMNWIFSIDFENLIDSFVGALINVGLILKKAAKFFGRVLAGLGKLVYELGTGLITFFLSLPGMIIKTVGAVVLRLGVAIGNKFWEGLQEIWNLLAPFREDLTNWFNENLIDPVVNFGPEIMRSLKAPWNDFVKWWDTFDIMQVFDKNLVEPMAGLFREGGSLDFIGKFVDKYITGPFQRVSAAFAKMDLMATLKQVIGDPILGAWDWVKNQVKRAVGFIMTPVYNLLNNFVALNNELVDFGVPGLDRRSRFNNPYAVASGVSDKAGEQAQAARESLKKKIKQYKEGGFTEKDI